ncbi:hypothetical protein ACNJUL_20575, partial [Mycobacterium tuberculosis]
PVLRRRPAGRTRGCLLRSTPETSRRLRSQIRESPDSPGRFIDDIADWVEGARCAGMRAYLVDRSGQTRDGVVRDLSSLGAILDGAGP